MTPRLADPDSVVWLGHVADNLTAITWSRVLCAGEQPAARGGMESVPLDATRAVVISGFVFYAGILL